MHQFRPSALSPLLICFLMLACAKDNPVAVTQPSAPSNLSATAVSGSQINLTWNDASDDETGFKIERKTGVGGNWSQIAQTRAGLITYQDGGVAPNTTYYYRVVAYNGAGNSAYSNEASATTPQVPPATPSNLSATAVSASQINLTWNDGSTNEDGFKLERKTGPGGSWSQIPQVGVGVTTYQDAGLAAGTNYLYRVCAFNSAGSSGYSNEASATTFQVPPNAPTNLSAIAVSGSRINLIWSDMSNNEDGFRIERKTGAGGSWSQIAQTAADAPGYSDTDLSLSTEYWYRVLAFNSAGNSPYSNEAVATTSDGTIVILNEGFEGNWPGAGWAVSGNPTWDDDILNHHTGAWAAWCAGGGASARDPSISPYNNNMNAQMIFGPFNLSDAVSGSFSFWEAWRTEVNYDWCYYSLSTDGVNWYGLGRSGEGLTWRQVQVSFSNFYENRNWLGNPQVWLRFKFTSDLSNTNVGWWVDDIYITKRTQGVRVGPERVVHDSEEEVLLNTYSPDPALQEQAKPQIGVNQVSIQEHSETISLPDLR